jgi:hypothetical protein
MANGSTGIPLRGMKRNPHTRRMAAADPVLDRAKYDGSRSRASMPGVDDRSSPDFKQSAAEDTIRGGLSIHFIGKRGDVPRLLKSPRTKILSPSSRWDSWNSDVVNEISAQTEDAGKQGLSIPAGHHRKRDPGELDDSRRCPVAEGLPRSQSRGSVVRLTSTGMGFPTIPMRNDPR